MADNVMEPVQDVQPPAAPAVDPAKAALDAQMAIALGTARPAQQQAAAPAEVVEPAAPATEPAQPISVDPFGLIKDKFGFQSHEDAIKEIEELRNFKANPTTAIEFDNEESEKLFKAISAGKKDEVYQILERQHKLEKLVSLDVNKDTAPEIVKYGMQLKYKDLTPDEINYKFNKQFAIPPKPVQSVDEEDTDYQNRVSQWQDIVNDKQMELMIEAKLIKPELETSKSKITLPEIEQAADEDYIQYRKMLEDAATLDAEVKEAYKAFTPKLIETKLNFKDEANKIDFQFQYEPDGESFSKTVAMASDMNLFWSQFRDQAGKPDRQKFLQTIHNGLNLEKILISAMTQAKNAAIKSMLPDNSQAGGLVRQITPTPQEQNPLDAKMRQALQGYM